MDKIPHDLVRYLMELGLLESEARIYIALTMMNNSEVKNLIDFLGLSKPNTYESLRLLEERSRGTYQYKTYDLSSHPARYWT